MLEYFKPEDKEYDDTDNHKLARIKSQEPVNTAEDKDFTLEEIRNEIESMESKKSARRRRGNWRDLQRFFRNFSQLYNSHVQRVFKKMSLSSTVEKSKTDTNYKTGKENSEDVYKFRPIGLLNRGGKVLEKVLINIINHHI